MARWRRVGTVGRARVVYEANEPLTDRNHHKILPGELHTAEKVALETGTTSIRGTWPLCRRQCFTFRDQDVHLDAEVAG